METSVRTKVIAITAVSPCCIQQNRLCSELEDRSTSDSPIVCFMLPLNSSEQVQDLENEAKRRHPLARRILISVFLNSEDNKLTQFEETIILTQSQMDCMVNAKLQLIWKDVEKWYQSRSNFDHLWLTNSNRNVTWFDCPYDITAELFLEYLEGGFPVLNHNELVQRYNQGTRFFNRTTQKGELKVISSAEKIRKERFREICTSILIDNFLNPRTISVIHEYLITRLYHYRLAQSLLEIFHPLLPLILNAGTNLLNDGNYETDQSQYNSVPREERMYRVLVKEPKTGDEISVIQICNVLHRYCDNYNYSSLLEDPAFQTFREALRSRNFVPNFAEYERTFSTLPNRRPL